MVDYKSTTWQRHCTLLATLYILWSSKLLVRNLKKPLRLFALQSTLLQIRTLVVSLTWVYRARPTIWSPVVVVPISAWRTSLSIISLSHSTFHGHYNHCVGLLNNLYNTTLNPTPHQKNCHLLHLSV